MTLTIKCLLFYTSGSGTDSDFRSIEKDQFAVTTDGQSVFNLTTFR